MTSEKDGTLIPGADSAPVRGTACKQGQLDLQPDPAALRDLAARFREDAAAASDLRDKQQFVKSAAEAESRAEAIEALTLWTAPAFRQRP